jgi:hypothetical protein
MFFGSGSTLVRTLVVGGLAYVAVVLETDGGFSIIKRRGSGLSTLVDVQGFPRHTG